MTQKRVNHEGKERTGNRFISPETPVGERIDEVASYCTGKEHQAKWLKRTLQQRWSEELPQPLIGFDDEEDTFIAEWQSDTECITLIIDADRHTGTYYPWPYPDTENLRDPLNLDTEEAWQLLRIALTTTKQ